MSKEHFEKTLKFILQREGGYVNDPNDLGGETNKGITYRTYNACLGSSLTSLRCCLSLISSIL